MKKFLLLIVFLASCSNQKEDPNPIAMIQIVDRMGMNETIKSKEKLKTFAEVDYEKPQPYEKVTRVLAKQGLTPQKSIITTYHDNGYLKEYLEAVSHRAHGLYKEFYPNGNIKIFGHIIEGIADLTEAAKNSYIFDGVCQIFYPNGKLQATIIYQKGKLQGESTYYHANGKIEKKIPYNQDQIDGVVYLYDLEENIIGFTEYQCGTKHGKLEYLGDKLIAPFEEWYELGLLKNGDYFNFKRELISQIVGGYGVQSIYENGKLSKEIEYQKGIPEGTVKTYYPSSRLKSIYSIQNGLKHGEEWVYYDNELSTPKLFLTWYEDQLHGSQKSWYEDGSLESQKEMVKNKKQGSLIAWYQTGGVMLIEDYDAGKLIEGAYFTKGSKEKISSVTHGKGIATIYDKNGFFIHKIRYEKGEIISE